MWQLALFLALAATTVIVDGILNPDLVALRTGGKHQRASLINEAWAIPADGTTSALQGAAIPGTDDIDCETTPTICATLPTYDAVMRSCDDAEVSPINVTKRIAYLDGRPNPHWMCSPGGEKLVPGWFWPVQCLAKGYSDPQVAIEAAQWSVEAGVGGLDASTCFLAGHCADTTVTNETTFEDMELICDSKFGHDNWTSVGFDDILPRDPFAISPQDWVRDAPRIYTMVSCAMGAYRCDVTYCKETYCKDPDYIEKFGGIAPNAPVSNDQALEIVSGAW